MFSCVTLLNKSFLRRMKVDLLTSFGRKRKDRRSGKRTCPSRDSGRCGATQRLLIKLMLTSLNGALPNSD